LNLPVNRENLHFCDKTINILLDHIFNLACPKFKKKIKKISDVLPAYLFLRQTIWHDSFKKDGSTDKNVVLYLFLTMKGNSQSFLSVGPSFMKIKRVAQL
jgi:hypothetical protein